MRWAMAVLLLAGIAVTGCGSGGDDPGAVSKKDYEADGKTWPLTVDHGTLLCTKGQVTINAGGKIYGVNGLALSDPRAPDVAEITRDDEATAKQVRDSTGQDPNPAPKMSVGDLIEQGLTLCE